MGIAGLPTLVSGTGFSPHWRQCQRLLELAVTNVRQTERQGEFSAISLSFIKV